ncbi:penicillin-binding protein 1C [Devosia sp. ZB163]|uniref:penicillin-binding protein 1C n=1 Tax=Devosia sp. ZB163 TaxID=3025938 RepID=UPI002361A5A1|nr:penicillin-binding protein 1C [Devosia sp. ZB163]MDC9825246.1 penicillin-binding protein 1C [Devosia sp. ZB163]
MAGQYGLAVLRDIRETIPAPPAIATLPVSKAVVDKAGLLLRPFTTDGGRWRLPVTIADVDRRFLDMLLAYEDQHFAEHHGIEWSAMVRAALQYAGAGGQIVSGGSTLTMQVARLLEREPTRNLGGKIRQMVHADMLEGRLSKDEILTLYLTLAPYGGNIEGIRAASLAYFGKEPNRLTTAESALLVALPQSPEARRPDRDSKAALAARDRVLDRMVAQGVISAEEAEISRLEPVPTMRREFPMHAAHLAEQAVKARPNAREIELTVDRRLQAALEKLGADRAAQLGSKLSVAIVVADQASGNILASVGSAGLFNSESDGFVDMTSAVRSPGSTLKPLIYGLAFELGMAHPESLIEDRPTAFNGYVPVNFDGFNRGTVTIRQALTESLNIPAIVVLDAVGPARLVARMKRAHAKPLLPVDTAPSLAVGLGGVGVTLRDLVSIYAAIARGGSPVVLRDGVQPPPTEEAVPAPVLDPVAAWYVANVLADVPPPLNGSAGRIAYKTGTSYGYRDAWAVGFDGKTVIGVWVGRPDNSAVPGITGISAAAPILFESFDRLSRTTVPLREAPRGVIFASNSELPNPLKRFRHPDEQKVKRDAAPEIAYPEDGVDVDLGIASGDSVPLIVKVRNGVPPFTFFANGAPFGRSAFARQESWRPDGPGFVTLSVVDAEGRSDSVKVFLD